MPSIRIGIGIDVNSRVVNWTPQNHLFALPSTGVSLIVGTEVTIYGDSLVNVPIVNSLHVRYTCDIGTQSGNNFTINPVTDDIGDHILNMAITNGGKTTKQTITLTVRAKVVDGSLDLLMVGDSTLAGVITAGTLESNLSGVDITFIGTQGTTKKHEGRGGWNWWQFATHATSPFRKGGVIDIPAYFTDNSIVVPEIVYFRLGINDILQFTTVGTSPTDAQITTILDYSASLVDAFLAYNSKLKIIMGIPSSCGDYVDGWNADFDEAVVSQDRYIKDLQRFRSALITKYAGGVYNARVDCSYEAINIDRTNGYTNGVHPDASGYAELGIGLSPYVSKLMNEMFGVNLIPAESSRFTTDGTGYWTSVLTKGWDASGYMNGTGTGIASWNALFQKANLLTIGKTYKFSIKVKSANYSGQLAINMGSGNTTPYATFAVTTSWVLKKGRAIAASNKSLFLLNANSFTGTIDIDDWILQEVL